MWNNLKRGSGYTLKKKKKEEREQKREQGKKNL